MILLEDRSLWQISPLGFVDSILWLPIEDIVVTTGGFYPYAYRLINVDSGDTVDARFLGYSR